MPAVALLVKEEDSQLGDFIETLPLLLHQMQLLIPMPRKQQAGS